MDVSDPYADLDELKTSDETTSSSESDEDGGLTDEQIESTIRLLSQVVEASPNDYQSRIQLIGLLRQQGDMEEAISHREALASLFPLGESSSALRPSLSSIPYPFRPESPHQLDSNPIFSPFCFLQMCGLSGLKTRRRWFRVPAKVGPLPALSVFKICFVRRPLITYRLICT